MTLINIKEWTSSEGDTCEDSHDLEYSQVELSNISTLINSKEEFISSQRKSFGMTPRDVSLSILWGVVGAFAGESTMIKSRNANSVSSYMEKAFERLYDNEDSGLLLPESFSGWNAMNDTQKENIQKECIEAADLIEDFPSFEDMMIVAAQEKCVVPFGSEDLFGYIPVVVKSKKGIAGIIPVFDKHDYCSASAFNNMTPKNNLLYVENINIWDISAGKITKPYKDAIIRAEESFITI